MFFLEMGRVQVPLIIYPFLGTYSFYFIKNEGRNSHFKKFKQFSKLYVMLKCAKIKTFNSCWTNINLPTNEHLVYQKTMAS